MAPMICMANFGVDFEGPLDNHEHAVAGKDFPIATKWRRYPCNIAVPCTTGSTGQPFSPDQE